MMGFIFFNSCTDHVFFTNFLLLHFLIGFLLEDPKNILFLAIRYQAELCAAYLNYLKANVVVVLWKGQSPFN